MKLAAFLLAALAVPASLFALQQFRDQPKAFREYPGWEYENFPLPPDFSDRAEWTFARLMYPPIAFGRWGRSDWTEGESNWTTDYPRSDRHLIQILRRLTRLNARSVEQPVNLDDGSDVYNWPFLYGVEVGHWDLTENQAKKLREYLLRGGFFMCDDFHGTVEWEIFATSMRRVFPDRPIVEIENRDAIFHTVFDLDDRYQVPGAQFLRSRRTYEQDGFEARWRGIYDDKGRLMVAICHNVDLGDSWEWADDPRYPEKYAALGLRIGVNYVIYALTH